MMMLMLGLYMIFSPIVIIFCCEHVPEWLSFIGTILSMTGWGFCTASWFSVTEKLKNLEKQINKHEEDK